MAEDKKSFVCYASWINFIKILSNEQAGQLIKHILSYVNDENPNDPEDVNVLMAWSFIKQQLKEDLVKWKETRDKRSEAGKKGNEVRWHSENNNNKKSQCDNVQSQQVANIAVNDNVNVNVNVNDNVLSKDNNIKENNNTLSKDNVLKEKKRFVKPSIEEITKYCEERNNNVDANKFYDFYESKGWKVGNSPMKDWKACVRTWEQRDSGAKQKSQCDIKPESLRGLVI